MYILWHVIIITISKYIFPVHANYYGMCKITIMLPNILLGIRMRVVNYPERCGFSHTHGIL